MKAMTIDAYGQAPRMTELPTPVPGEGEVLVRVKASSINPIDWKQASGKLRPILTAKLPGFIPGYDIAGEVEAVGLGVTQWTKGQRVNARLSGNGAGACAEYVLAKASDLALLPVSVDFATGAGLPLAGMTALQGLRDNLQMPMQDATQRVLVIGASGGVGHFAIQLARAAGATVVGVCSERNVELVKSLGANEVIDYTKPAAWASVAPFDLILDCVGHSPGDYLPRLKDHGRFASCLPTPGVFLNAALNVMRGKKVSAVMLKPSAVDLQQLNDWAAVGRLRVHIDSRLPLEQLSTAWEKSQSGRAVGKIVLDVP